MTNHREKYAHVKFEEGKGGRRILIDGVDVADKVTDIKVLEQRFLSDEESMLLVQVVFCVSKFDVVVADSQGHVGSEGK